MEPGTVREETTVAILFFFFQAEDGIRDTSVTGVQTCALPIYLEEGIDAPNEGHGEIEESRNGKIGPHDRAWAHAATSCVSVHALSAVAVRITAPPITASGPGVSPCASHAHTGLSTGSTRRNSDASSAGTCVIARDRNT